VSDVPFAEILFQCLLFFYGIPMPSWESKGLSSVAQLDIIDYTAAHLALLSGRQTKRVFFSFLYNAFSCQKHIH